MIFDDRKISQTSEMIIFEEVKRKDIENIDRRIVTEVPLTKSNLLEASAEHTMSKTVSLSKLSSTTNKKSFFSTVAYLHSRNYAKLNDESQKVIATERTPFYGRYYDGTKELKFKRFKFKLDKVKNQPNV
eukprot:TRINITY_DN11642_c0_g1_i3.p1 TRINITY_DN11642_c0_g1~~TRINITY_DN11642_c0_g1_i3.p1  ORF type:complete len:130 (+),score=24.44 TRINITY_DN11642_c0_g1_i3:374-763(+)